MLSKSFVYLFGCPAANWRLTYLAELAWGSVWKWVSVCCVCVRIHITYTQTNLVFALAYICPAKLDADCCNNVDGDSYSKCCCWCCYCPTKSVSWCLQWQQLPLTNMASVPSVRLQSSLLLQLAARIEYAPLKCSINASRAAYTRCHRYKYTQSQTHAHTDTDTSRDKHFCNGLWHWLPAFRLATNVAIVQPHRIAPLFR